MFSAKFLRRSFIVGLAVLTGSIAQAQTLLFNGSVDSNWQNAGNWNPSAPGFHTTLSEVRLNVNGSATALKYTGAEGNTVFDVSPVGGVDRAIVVAVVNDTASGILNISGGSITIIKRSTQNVPLLIGAGTSNAWNGNAVLERNGGLDQCRQR